MRNIFGVRASRFSLQASGARLRHDFANAMRSLEHPHKQRAPSAIYVAFVGAPCLAQGCFLVVHSLKASFQNYHLRASNRCSSEGTRFARRAAEMAVPQQEKYSREQARKGKFGLVASRPATTTSCPPNWSSRACSRGRRLMLMDIFNKYVT